MKKSYLFAAMALLSIQLSAKDFFVKTTGTGDGTAWGTATTLQSAIEKASDGDVIYIAAGTYTPTALPEDTVQNPRSRTFAITKNISLIGGYPADASEGAIADAAANITTLSGKWDDTTQAFHVVCISTNAATKDQKVLLQGLTISDGKADVTMDTNNHDRVTINNNPFLFTRGAGLVCVNSNLDLINCNIRSNEGINPYGGAVAYFHNELTGGNINISNCTFSDNISSKESAIFAWGPLGNINIKNTAFKRQTGVNGGGLGIGKLSIATIDGCTFEQNTVSSKGGGLFVKGGAKVTVSNSNFTQNKSSLTTALSPAGGAFCASESNTAVDFSNCTFSGNEARTSSTIAIISSSSNSATATFKKCTFQDANIDATIGKTDYLGGVLYVTGAVKTIFTDCSFINNKARAAGCFHVGASAQVTLENCLLKGNKATAESPCVRADGKNAYVLMNNCTLDANEFIELQEWNCQTIVAYNIAQIDIYNTLIKDTKGAKNGSAISVRKGGLINLVNSTITGNVGANPLFVWEKNTDGTLSRLNVVSSTVVDNSCTDDVVLSKHADGIANSYNTIYSGNTAGTNSNPVNCSKSACIIETVILDKAGAEVADKLFTKAFMLEGLADNGGPTSTCKLIELPAGRENYAMTCGMSTSELNDLATTLNIDLAKVKYDARGVERKGLNMGAYAEGSIQSGIIDNVINSKTFIVYVEDGTICINAQTATTVNVYNASGVRVLTKIVNEGINRLSEISNKGYYLLKADNKSMKIIL